MKKVAIIGMGVAGVSVFRAMAKQAAYQDCQIVLYDDSKTFGTGMPYQADSKQLLINQTADTMSLEIEDPLDFVKWVAMKKGISNGAKEFFPRVWYGEYMQEKLAPTIQLLQPDILYEEVTALRVKKDGTYIVQSASALEQYDSVHLCIGHLPYQDPYHLIGNQGYIHHPYPVQEKLTQFPKGARIGIIGTGLTSVDLMRFLNKQEKNYTIHFFSHQGRFSLYRGSEPAISLRFLTPENVRQAKRQHDGFVPLEKMLEWFYLECQDKEVDFDYLKTRFGKGSKEQLNLQLKEETDLGMLQAIIHKMDFHLAEFMQALTKADKELFYTEYESLFKHFRTPMPKSSLEELMFKWNADKIKVWENMQAVESGTSGFEVQLEEKETVAVDYLVNATGHGMQAEASTYQSQLINQLLNEWVLQPELFGGVQVVWPSAQAVSQRYGVLNRLYVHGQLVQGIQYGNNAHLLMRQAEQVVAADAKNSRSIPG